MSQKMINLVEATPPYQSHSDYAFSASIADHSTRAQVGSAINVAGRAGSIMTLVGIEICIKSTATTTVNTGGLVEVENDAIDWKPLEIYPNSSSYVGANAGGAQSPMFLPLHKPLPAGSNISVFYTAQNAATDKAYVTLFWTTKPWDARPQTFIKSGIGTALTQVTSATSHVSIVIPANKGGSVVGFLGQVYGTIETIVVSGGQVTVHNTSAQVAWEPFRFTLGGITSIGTGGGENLVCRVPAHGDAAGNGTFTFDYIPTDNQSQAAALGVVWEA